MEVLRRIRDGGEDIRGPLLGSLANLNASQCYLDTPFLEVIARYAKEYPSRLGPIHMSKLAFCFTSLGVENEDFMEAIQSGKVAFGCAQWNCKCGDPHSFGSLSCLVDS